MAVNNGTQSYNVSRDCRLKWIAPDGTQIDLSQLTEFNSKEETDSFDVPILAGPTFHQDLPKNWSGSFTVARKNSDIDKMFSALDDLWFNQGTVNVGSLFQFVKKPGGGEDVFHYTGVSFKYDDAGTFSGDNKPVMQKIGFTAQRRLVL